jgi:hypothetical protein
MKETNTESGSDKLAFAKMNYILMGAGALMVVIGFFLMSGGGSEDLSVYSDAIFSFRRWTLAPIVVCSGYALVFYAIMKKAH